MELNYLYIKLVLKCDLYNGIKLYIKLYIIIYKIVFVYI